MKLDCAHSCDDKVGVETGKDKLYNHTHLDYRKKDTLSVGKKIPPLNPEFAKTESMDPVGIQVLPSGANPSMRLCVGSRKEKT